MYMFEVMIELGLKDGQKFPTDAHRQVACTLALGNPRVQSRGHLTQIVQHVINVPEERIKKVTLNELLAEGCPI